MWKSKMSKKDLIKLLKDEDVQKIIQDICSIEEEDEDNGSTATSQEIEALKEENMNLEKLVEKFKKCFTDEQSKVETQSKKLDSFEKIIEAYELYKSLSLETKESLKGIFKDNSIEGFLACGVQEKNIGSFWEYLKTELIEENNKEIQNLLKIFDFFFQQYTLAFPNIEKQSVSKGEKYNTNIHIKQKGKQSGIVKSVVLYGWENSINDKVIKKTLVEVG